MPFILKGRFCFTIYQRKAISSTVWSTPRVFLVTYVWYVYSGCRRHANHDLVPFFFGRFLSFVAITGLSGLCFRFAEFHSVAPQANEWNYLLRCNQLFITYPAPVSRSPLLQITPPSPVVLMLINISLPGKITSHGYDRRYQTTEELSLTIQDAGCRVDLQSTLCEKMKSFENRYT